MFTTGPVFGDCYNILMEQAPSDVDIEQVRKELQSIKGVKSIEDFHLWSLSGGKYCLTAHLRLQMTDKASTSQSAILSRSTANYTTADGSFMQRSRIYHQV